jgi:zinc transport system substrate-binding protein
MEKIQSIATELDATIVTLHNIEKLTEEDVANGETYYTLMKKNMNTLVEMVK